MKRWFKFLALGMSMLTVISVSGCGDDSSKDNAKKAVVEKVKKEASKQINQIKPLGPTDFYVMIDDLDACFAKDLAGSINLLQGKTVELYTTAGIYSDNKLTIMHIGDKVNPMFAEMPKIQSGDYDRFVEICSKNKKKNAAFVVLKGEIKFEKLKANHVGLTLENTQVLKAFTNLIEFREYLIKQLENNKKRLKATHKALDSSRPQEFDGYGHITSNSGRCILYSNYSKESAQLAVLKTNTKVTISHYVLVRNGKYPNTRWYRIKVNNDGKEGWVESDWVEAYSK